MGVLKLDTLPIPQQMAFEQLTFTRERFVLFGGTAVALLAGHRVSVDFDFFGSDPLTEKDKRAILRSLSLDAEYPRIQNSEDTLSLRLPLQDDNDKGVMISFFGNIDKPRFRMPYAAQSGPRIASPLDLAGFKLAMAYQRNKEDDLIDLAALLELGQTMARAVRVMDTLYPGQVSLHHAVASAAWFEDREPSDTGKLTGKMKRTLESAVANYTGPDTELKPETARLSAPGFRPADVATKNDSNKEAENRVPGE